MRTAGRVALVFAGSLFALSLAGPLGQAVAEDAPPLAKIERRLPPQGIEISPEDRQRLNKALAELQAQIEVARETEKPSLADAAVYHKAVAYALLHDEFYKPGDVKLAEELLATAGQRLKHINAGRIPWTREHGLVVRGYESRIDGSVQPYGLVIPENLDLSQPAPLYVWLHGRGDKTTDMHFIRQRETSVGRIAPEDAIVLHPFGRHCNAFKHAGEVDVFEALAAVQKEYNIDPDRIVLWGFSMGGAGCWHLGAHHPDRWVCLSPGAGFAETRRYQNLQPEKYPSEYEQTLWNLFDAPSYVRNLFNLPVIAYSGEVDKQIQAARVMEEAYVMHGRKLPHMIGPGMGHKYHPEVLKQLAARVAGHVEEGLDHHPQKVTLQTRTLRYNHCHWMEILGLQQHWADSRIDAVAADDGSLRIDTLNVTAFRLSPPWPGKDVFAKQQELQLHLDGKSMTVAVGAQSQEALIFQRQGDRWVLAHEYPPSGGLRKVHGLQGPIDDVWMEPFLVVTPSGASQHPQVEKWVQFEMDHLLNRWRALFRGEARAKRDDEVTQEDLERYHLVVWGDGRSNKLLARLKDRLPLGWDDKSVTVGPTKYDAAHHVPVMIYPNPLNAKKYVVVNSGMTFREGHDRTNSLQNPKLPDWAVIDLNTPADDTKPGKVVQAGFFDEAWRLKE